MWNHNVIIFQTRKKNISVKTSLSAAEVVSLIFVVVPCKWGLKNEGKCSKHWCVIRSNERNTLYQKKVIHSLICNTDCIFFFHGRFFSPKISCLCFRPHFCQGLQLKHLEHTFSFFFSTIGPPSWLSAFFWCCINICSEILWSQSQAFKHNFNTYEWPFEFFGSHCCKA